MGKKKRKAQGASEVGNAGPDPAEGVDAPVASAEAEAIAEASSGPPTALQPLSDAPLPLERLPPDFLGGFFELCFPDPRLLELCRELTLTAPGYRLEALPPDQVARLLADEALAAKDARLLLDKAVRGALRSPALEDAALSREQVAGVLALQTTGDPLQQIARIVWKALLEGDPANGNALDAIQDGLDLLEAQAQAQAGASHKPQRPPPPDARQAEEAVKRAERAEKERTAMREQLAAARTEIVAREQKLAEQARELAALRAEHSRVGAELSRLTAAGEGRALAEARRATDEARALAEKLRVAEEELEAAEERARGAEQRLRTASAASAATAPAAAAEPELPTDEEAASFLVPVLTREFYDSIVRWSRRMQRAAFDKIHLLAHDWRHGSLRAIPLEGVPGYYRIRVATDVRLIYRRDGGQLEILSLIDREDLDRYIRQARTRPG